MSAVIDTHHHDHAHGPAKGLMRWVLTTNHKDIGSMYLWFSFAMFLLGGSMAMVIRAELFQPGLQLVQPEFPRPPVRFPPSVGRICLEAASRLG